jgi:hypothetical protein
VDGGGAASSGQVGDICYSSGDCLAGTCLPFQGNFERVPGICSQACSTTADCPSGAICAPDFTGTLVNIGTSSTGRGCFQACASSGACQTQACVWDVDANSGVCAAVANGVCGQLIGTGNGCGTCINNLCCTNYEECVADVTCGKDFASCENSGTCATKLAASSDSIESTFGSCVASECAGLCP